jgi:hypothetical protein
LQIERSESCQAATLGYAKIKEVDMFEAKEERVWLDGKLIVTVWEEPVDDERLEGESWLDMRERTKPERKAAKEKTLERAKRIAWALNNGA